MTSWVCPKTQKVKLPYPKPPSCHRRGFFSWVKEKPVQIDFEVNRLNKVGVRKDYKKVLIWGWISSTKLRDLTFSISLTTKGMGWQHCLEKGCLITLTVINIQPTTEGQVDHDLSHFNIVRLFEVYGTDKVNLGIFERQTRYKNRWLGPDIVFIIADIAVQEVSQKGLSNNTCVQIKVFELNGLFNEKETIVTTALVEEKNDMKEDESIIVVNPLFHYCC